MDSDLILPEGSAQHSDRVDQVFGQELAKRMLSIAIPIHSADMRMWRSSCGQRIGAGDLYAMYFKPPTRRLDATWIWRLPVHPWVSLFIWRVAQDYLPTKLILRKKGVSMSLLCPCCGTEDESIDHVLFCCPRMMHIWRLAGLLHEISSSDRPTQEFLDSLRLSLDSEITRVLRTHTAYNAYHIWLSRNSWVFDSRMLSTHFVLERALRSLNWSPLI